MTKREKPVPLSRRLVKSLPKLSPLLREAFKTSWTDAQCDAAGRDVPPAEVLRQTEAWLAVLHKAGHDAPYSPGRVAWLAELAVSLDDALAGRVTPELEARRTAHAAAAKEAEGLRARLASRLVLLVGGDEERRAARAIAAPSLEALVALLAQWRSEARLRVLADELGLGEELRAHALLALEAVRDTEGLLAQPRAELQPPSRIVGALVRELQAVQRAFASARDAGLRVPVLTVRPALKSLLA